VVSIGIVLIHLPKKERGEFFPNLGMLTTLLPNKPSSKQCSGVVHPVMEVLGSKDHQEGEATLSSSLRQQEVEEGVFDWHVEQTLPPPHVSCLQKFNVEFFFDFCVNYQENDLMTGLHPYGFARKHCGVFMKLQVNIIHTFPFFCGQLVAAVFADVAIL